MKIILTTSKYTIIHCIIRKIQFLLKWCDKILGSTQKNLIKFYFFSMGLYHLILVLTFGVLIDEFILDFHTLFYFVVEFNSSIIFFIKGICYAITYLTIAYFVFEFFTNMQTEAEVRRNRRRAEQLEPQVDYNLVKYNYIIIFVIFNQIIDKN